MQHYKIRIRTILFMSVFLSFLLSSCSLTRRMETDQSKVQDRNVIVFLVFNISKDSVQGKNLIELVSKTESSGKIKEDAQSPAEFEDYLSIEVLEQNQRPNVITVEHPLHKHIEFVDDRGELASKYVELNQAEFFIRFQSSGNPLKIRISETLKNGVKSELKSFKL